MRRRGWGRGTYELSSEREWLVPKSRFPSQVVDVLQTFRTPIPAPLPLQPARVTTACLSLQGLEGMEVTEVGPQQRVGLQAQLVEREDGDIIFRPPQTQPQ